MFGSELRNNPARKKVIVPHVSGSGKAI